ncbi:nose resistant to fluoxetine protein 6 [Trichonephila clavipes]|nr:nose resistant to fluoxetine protein 6 [Trichonephila clavipes]
MSLPTGRILEAFSLASNGRRLFSAPGGSSTEFACIHGIRALSMFWVVLGHTYVLMDFELLKDPSGIQSFFRALEFELVHNGWLAVETFFLLSGVLMSVGGLKFLQKSKGCFNIPLMALRRYLRLAPSLLLLMGLVFFLPLLSSGPFWYQHVDPQVKSCAEYWWASLLFISNWFGINKGVLQGRCGPSSPVDRGVVCSHCASNTCTRRHAFTHAVSRG